MKDDFVKRHFSHCFTKKGESRLLSKMAVPVPRTKINDLYYCPNIALETTFDHWKSGKWFLALGGKNSEKWCFFSKSSLSGGGSGKRYRVISWNSSPGWLVSIFSFRYRKGGRQLKKSPCLRFVSYIELIDVGI